MIYRLIDAALGILAFYIAHYAVGVSVEFALIFAAIFYLSERYDSINRQGKQEK